MQFHKIHAVTVQSFLSSTWADAWVLIENITNITRLNLETAKETDILNSSGFFCASAVIRLVAAVTTPWMEEAKGN